MQENKNNKQQAETANQDDKTVRKCDDHIKTKSKQVEDSQVSHAITGTVSLFGAFPKLWHHSISQKQMKHRNNKVYFSLEFTFIVET